MVKCGPPGHGDAVLDLGGITEIAQLEGGRSRTVCVMGESRIRAICTYMRDDPGRAHILPGPPSVPAFFASVWATATATFAPEEAGRRCFPGRAPHRWTGEAEGTRNGEPTTGTLRCQRGRRPRCRRGGLVKLGHVSLERKYRRKGHICRGVIPGSACIWPCLRIWPCGHAASLGEQVAQAQVVGQIQKRFQVMLAGPHPGLPPTPYRVR